MLKAMEMKRAVDGVGLTFQTDAERVLSRVRNAFAQVLEILRRDTQEGKSLDRALGIDRTLSWKIQKVAHSADLFVAAQHMPGSTAMEIFLKAAIQRDVPGDIVESAAHALADFEKLVELHAGDRASFEIMAAGFTKRVRASASLAHCRAAVRANAGIWGVHAAAQLRTDVIWPSSRSGQVDIASLRGFVGFRRLRPDVPWVIARSRCSDNDGRVRRIFAPEPIDPAGHGEGELPPVPLLRDFCSRPLPEFRRVAWGDGYLDDELLAGPVGNRGAVTCIAGEVSRSVASYFRDGDNTFGEFIVTVRTPCDALVFDLLVHEDLFPDSSPEFAVYSELAGGAPFPAGNRTRQPLPIPASVDLIGRGPEAVHCAEVPRYAEMIRYALDKLAWNGSRLRVYRVCLPFPPMPASVVMRYELPEKPC
jgi:hypothetical protein